MNAFSRRNEVALKNQRLLSRIKNSNPDHFVRLVHVHFAANLGGNHPEKTNVAELLGGSSSTLSLLAEKCKTPLLPQTNEVWKFRFQKKKSPKGIGTIFGVPLTEEIVKRIYPLIRYLNTTDCQKRVGLFRKSGSAVKQKELCEILNRGNDVESQLNASHFNAHDVACVLKLFLRLLPDPLLTERHIRAYYLVSGIPSSSDRTEMLQLMMLLLPPENATLLRHLLDLLHRTSEEKDNLMDRNALAIVIAPNLFTLRNLSASQIQAMTAASISIVQFMIEKANVIFNVPDKLMQDVRSYLEETPAIDVQANGRRNAAGDGERCRCANKSDGVACVTNHESYRTLENVQSISLRKRVESVDSMLTVSSHSSGVDVQDSGTERERERQKTGEDRMLSNRFDTSDSVKPTRMKKRTRSLGDTLRNIFQRCKSVVYGSPPRMRFTTKPVVKSNVSPMIQNLRVTDVDSDDIDLCGQKQDSPPLGNDDEVWEPSSESPQPPLSQVNAVDVASSRTSRRQLFPHSSNSSDDLLPPSAPNSVDATTLQVTVHSTSSPISATSGHLTPSAAKYRSRKIHPLHNWRTKSGLGAVKGRRLRTMTTTESFVAPRESDAKESIFFEPHFEVANFEADNLILCISLDDSEDDSEQIEPTAAEYHQD